MRGLLRRPGYTVLALTTLVLGVGSVTAGYGLLHQVVLRPLPYEDTERLVTVRTLYDSDVVGVTLPEYLELAEHADVLESVAALVEPHLDEDWIWTGRDDRTVLSAVRVTRDFFTTLGIEPDRGSLAHDDRSGERRVVVSHDFWQQDLGAGSHGRRAHHGHQRGAVRDHGGASGVLRVPAGPRCGRRLGSSSIRSRSRPGPTCLCLIEPSAG